MNIPCNVKYLYYNNNKINEIILFCNCIFLYRRYSYLAGFVVFQILLWYLVDHNRYQVEGGDVERWGGG
jgi:hypothetical protein